MPSLFYGSEFRVGVFITIVAALIAMLSIRASEDPGFIGGSKKVYFYLDDASGLIVRSAVKMAGIDIGVIKSIKLEKGKARVELSVSNDAPITTSSGIEVRPNGILGDKYVEVIPGKEGEPLLADGEQIVSVENKASMDAIIKEVGKITDSIGEVAEKIKLAVSDDGVQSGPLGRIIYNIDKLTADLAEFSEGNKNKISEIVDNVKNITDTLDEVINSEDETGFRASWNRVSNAIAKLDRSMSNVEEITDKINSGKGTIGRLINDEETVDSLNTAIAGVNNFVGGASKIQTSLDFHSEWMNEQGLAKSYLSVKIQPGLDRYYELGIVDDPKGVVERVDTTTTGAGGTVSTSETKVFKNKLKFTALFAKNFGNFTVKGGMIESSGGLGFDYFLFRRSLRLSSDIFEFSNEVPHVRTYARYYFYRGIYITGGADDYLSRDGRASSFLGAGIDLTNDDLKLLLSKASF